MALARLLPEECVAGRNGMRKHDSPSRRRSGCEERAAHVARRLLAVLVLAAHIRSCSTWFHRWSPCPTIFIFPRDRSTFVLTLLLLLPACLRLLLFISATPTTKSGELTWKRVDTYTVNFELRTAWERTGYPTTLTRMTVSLRNARSPPAR